MRYPATLRAGIVLNSQEFAARALTFVIIDVSVQVLTVISELAIFRKRNAESDALSICATGRYSIKFSGVGYRAVSLRQLMRFSLNGNRYPRKRHIPELRSRNAESRIYSKKSPLHFIIFAWICQ